MISDEELIQLVKKRKELEFDDTKERQKENIKKWTTFYRRNLDLFNEDYLGIKISLFQKQRINTLSDNDFSVVIASRGSAKTFDTGLFALDCALLYSNCKILVVAYTLGQANIIIKEKIQDIFCSNTSSWSSPILCKLKEEGWIKFCNDKTTDALIVEFGNGSRIFSVANSEGARGKRANIAIVDEFVLMQRQEVELGIFPTLEPRRFAGRPFDYPEETKQICLSSAKNKTNWGWNLLKRAVEGHYKNTVTKYGFFINDIYTSVANGIQTKKQLIQKKADTETISFQQEYLNIFPSNNDEGIYKFEDFEQNRVLKTAFIPRSPVDIAMDEPQLYKFNDNEIRIVATDIAMAMGEENDNTVIDLIAIDINTGHRKVEYITAANGMNTLVQVALMKRLFYEYHAHYFVMDTKGVGFSMFDNFTVKTFDEETGLTYPAWGVCEDSSLQISSDKVILDKVTRTMSNDTENVMIPYAGNAELNSQMHVSLRKNLKDKNIDLLVDESEAEANFESKDKNWLIKTDEYKVDKILPHKQTSWMINEAIALKAQISVNNEVKLSEAKKSDVKDRYMTLAMGNLFSDKITRKYLGDANEPQEIDKSVWQRIADACRV